MRIVGIKKMINKITFKIKYPKIFLLLLIYIVTIILFCRANTYYPLHNFFTSFGYIGIFFGGFFYSYGFTAAPATAILLTLAKQYNFIFAGIVGGIGALLSDTIIFLFIRHSFINEVNKLKKEKTVTFVSQIIKKLFGSYSNYFLPIIASFLIASPLPTEVGVALMATMKGITVKKFLLIAYLLHTFGIFVILYLGNI